LSEEFIKNLFSNPLRNIIQFLHREYTFDKKSFSLYNTEDAQRIQKQYNLKLLDGVETWKKYYLEAKKYLSDSEKKNDAIRYLNMSLEIEEREETYLELGNVYYSDERWDEAERIYNKILYIKPNSYNAYLKLGDIFRRKEDYTKAIDFYNKSISILPTYDAYNRLGICFFHDKNGKLDTVIEQFKNAINLDKDNPKAYLNLFEIVLFEKVDEGLLKKEFKKKFHDQVHSMKIYDMLIILDKIYHGIEDKEIIILFEIWNNQYKKTSISGWSFVELEKKIDQINIPKIKDKLNDYLKKFEDNM
jgi:tetratricopeptide (TPR) repeat protein